MYRNYKNSITYKTDTVAIKKLILDNNERRYNNKLNGANLTFLSLLVSKKRDLEVDYIPEI